MPKIGIIIATYNRDNLLLKTINSIKSQSYDNYIICVVDDGSKRDVREFLKEDDKLKIIRLDKNRGSNFARNEGVEYLKKRCDFITFIDDDDEFVENAFEIFVNDLKENTSQKWFLYKVTNKDGEVLSKFNAYGEWHYLWYMWRIKFFKDGHHFISTSVLDDTTKFSCEFKNGQEWYFFAHLSKKSKMFVINKVVKIVEYLPTGLSKNKDKNEYKIKYYFKIYIMKKLGYSIIKWKFLKFLHEVSLL